MLLYLSETSKEEEQLLENESLSLNMESNEGRNFYPLLVPLGSCGVRVRHDSER
jgi:PhoPQ-activated pathogenicity-related protein